MSILWINLRASAHGHPLNFTIQQQVCSFYLPNFEGFHGIGKKNSASCDLTKGIKGQTLGRGGGSEFSSKCRDGTEDAD